jgi:hypothetical protein
VRAADRLRRVLNCTVAVLRVISAAPRITTEDDLNELAFLGPACRRVMRRDGDEAAGGF